MTRFGIPFWRSAPFIRILIPFVAGILGGYYLSPGLEWVIFIFFLSLAYIALSNYFSFTAAYHLQWVRGAAINIVFACLGTWLIWQRDITHHPQWAGKRLTQSKAVRCIISEPFIGKPRSFKTTAKLTAIDLNNTWHPVTGNAILYFSVADSNSLPQEGDEIIITKNWQPIRNPPNSDFDYERYCAFRDIHFQVYLKPKEYTRTGKTIKNIFYAVIQQMQRSVLSVFRRWVPGQKELGVAEALLIGYRDDLDKDLTKAYSNTGVVHIIAISGLHLGMIYGLLLAVLKPFRRKKGYQVLKPLIILLVLWGFSLLAGAAASILRSVVMFSFIVIGESLQRKTNILNTMAASAFCLFLYDPYFLWDVGLQLSYTAVLSIVLFMKPVYQLLFFENRLLNAIWQLNAITLSAQILTLPVVLYYFHQFPVLFLFTNFIAVPLSGIILYAEIAMLVFAAIPFLNMVTGKLISFLIAALNGFIERSNNLPFAVISDIRVSVLQSLLLYGIIASLATWLMQKKPKAFLAAVVFIACTCLSLSWDKIT